MLLAIPVSSATLTAEIGFSSTSANILRKVSLSSRAAAAAWGVRAGLI
jgi:hypothetical protein